MAMVAAIRSGRNWNVQIAGPLLTASDAHYDRESIRQCYISCMCTTAKHGHEMALY